MEVEMLILQSIEEMLSHIKNVQSDVITLSSESLLIVSKFIEKNSLAIDDDVAKALQYQDIISQQLSATIDAIESIEKYIRQFTHAYHSDETLAFENIQKLQSRLATALEEARDKKNRFSGKLTNEDVQNDEIEFF
jgi:predicted RNA-binding protein with EMAP domain